MNAPHDDNPIITQFEPINDQWELNNENIQRIDPMYGQTILHNYCFYINSTPLEVFKYLIETMGCDVNFLDVFEETPLYLALLCFEVDSGGDVNVLRYLLSQANIDVNSKNEDGSTLLHTACGKINSLPLDIFKLLIESKGYDLSLPNFDDITPLLAALGQFNPNEGGDIAVLTYLFDQKDVDVNAKNQSGETLLHTACKCIPMPPPVVFKLLIETKGCDINALDNKNNTPLHYALQVHDSISNSSIYLLSQMDVDIGITGAFGRNLLHLACKPRSDKPLQPTEGDVDPSWPQVVEIIAEKCLQEILADIPI